MFAYLKPADKAVIEGLEKHEVVFAKDQPEYIPLRCLISRDRDSRAMSRWTFTDEQRKAIAEGADVYLELSTFGRPLQPIRMIVADKMNPDYWAVEFYLERRPMPADVVVRPGGE